MRKLLFVGLLLSAVSGCGRGWFPHLFHGAPCGSGLCSAPIDTCNGCNTHGYESYGDEGTVIGNGYLGSPVNGIETVPLGTPSPAPQNGPANGVRG
ncbi:MAG: hypothetical protein U0892_10930 [Pirellulales bacterium]